jgi:hypothetical protein
MVPVTLAGPLATDETVAFSVTGGTATPGPYTRDGLLAGADFKTRSGVVKFPSGVVAKKIAIKLYGDGSVEGAETVVITLSSPSSGLTLGRSVGTVTIDESDGTENPAYRGATREEDIRGVYVNNPSVVEGDSKVRVVTFSITTNVPCDVDVNWQLVAGTATGGWKGSGTPPADVDFADRLGQQGTVSFPTHSPLRVQKNITVKLAPDALPEETEQFSVVLSAPGPSFGCSTGHYAAIGPPGIGTILDDD